MVQKQNEQLLNDELIFLIIPNKRAWTYFSWGIAQRKKDFTFHNPFPKNQFPHPPQWKHQH